MTSNDLLRELAKARQELATLYEISNAMHKTLALDEILFIILTGVTSHSGLGFNRAMLLLLDSSSRYLEGKIGIGPDNAQEANDIWTVIDQRKMNLDALVDSYENAKNSMEKSKFFRLVKDMKVSVIEPEGGILAKAFNDGMPLHIKKEMLKDFPGDVLSQSFDSSEFVIVPLKSREKTIGVIVADNVFTKRPITRDDTRILTMFANQAGMAIENSQLYERTLIRTHKDSLTELWNHGYFQFIFDKRLKAAKEKLSYVSLILLDIDNFKNYNDTWGHQRGDQILIIISKIITESSRKIDTVCRYGGEEFAVVLPDASKADSLIIAERIRTNISDFNFSEDPASQPSLKISVSVGLATFPDDGKSKSDLIQAADKALYEAKRSGKNKVCTS